MATQTQNESEDSYQPQDALGAATKSAVTFGVLGFAVSAVSNALAKRNVGAMAVFTRTGGAIGLFSAVGGTYSFAQAASANLRRKNDTYNHAIGGAAAGAMASLRVRTFPALVGYSATFAVIMSAFEYTGGRLDGYRRDADTDEYERKEALRLNRRRPITETIEELGERRGIRAPGYEERRRERIKAAYGIDVGSSPSQAA